MTRKRRVILTLMLAGAAVAVIVLSQFIPPREHEPSYEGRTLSQWLTAYNENPGLRSEATNAVHHIGTNALRLLVNWISYKPPKWRETASQIADLVGGQPLQRSVEGAAAVRVNTAVTGFEILGLAAAPAVPALTNLVTNLLSDRTFPLNGYVRFKRAVLALQYIGSAGLPPLLSVVTNRAAPVEYRQTAVLRIGDMTGLGTNANWAVPVLIGCLDDSKVGGLVAIILGDLRLEPALAVPALTRCLQQESPSMRAAAESLGRFGQHAAAAVPDLVKALSSTNKYLRITATNALQSIAPEVLKSDGH